MQNTKKRKLSENITINDESREKNDQDTNQDEVMEVENVEQNEKSEKAPKKLKPFDVKVFRKSLKGTDFIFEIKRFTRIASEDPTIIYTYLSSKGTVLEIVEALLRLDQNNIFHISHVIDALSVILLEVVNSPEHLHGAQAGIAFLLNSNKSILIKLLSSDNQNHKSSALKLLTGAVVLSSSQFGVVTMRIMDNYVGEKTLEETLFKGFTLTEENLEDNIRKSYIQFILSFLIETDIQLVNQLLQREYLMLGLMKGLVYDDIRDLAVIVTTLKEQVLERPGILKTQKKRAFNEESINCLINVYNKYKGPQFLIHHKDKLVSEEQQKEAAEIVHEFCKTLLCSRKYGIAFNALGKTDKKNISQMLALRHMKFFWNHAEMSELVLAIIQACPELIRVLMDRIAIGIRPKMNESWFNCVLFTQNLIQDVDPKPILSSVKHMDPKKVSEYILNFSISQAILQHLDENSLLKGNVIDIRIQLIKLLSIMLRKCSLFLTTYAQMEDILDYDLRKIKFNIINQIFAYFPSIEALLNALNSSIKKSGKQKQGEIRQQLNSTLDIILLLHEMVPSVIQKSQDIVNYINVLSPIYNFHNEDSDKVGQKFEDIHEKLEVNLKIVKLMLILEPDVFQQKSELFQPVFETLIKVFTSPGISEKSKIFQNESLELLQKILLTTNCFDETLIEINAIILAFKQIPTKTHSNVINFIIDILRNEPTDDDADEEILQSHHSFMDENELNALFDRIDKMDVEEVINQDTDGMNLNPGIISLTFPRMLRQYKKLESSSQKPIKKYLDLLSLGLFYGLPDHTVVTSVVTTKELSTSTFFNTFLDKSNSISLLSEQSDSKLKIPTFVQEFFDSILTTNQLDDEFFNNDEIKSCPLQITQLIQVIIFCVIELSKRNNFTSEHRTICTAYYRNLIQTLNDLETKSHEHKGVVLEINDDKSAIQSISDWLLRYIFVENYQILSQFSLNGNQETSKFIADFAQDLNGMFSDCGKFMEHFRKKIVMEMKEILTSKNTRNEDEYEFFIKTLEAFDMKGNDSIEIIQKVTEMKLKKVHDKIFMTKLITFCLKTLTESKKFSLPDKTMSKLGQIITQIEFGEDAIEILYDYLNEFPHNIMDLDENFMSSLISSEAITISKALTKLLVLIFERDNRLHQNFPTLLEEIYTKKELAYPLLRSAFKLKLIDNESQKSLLAKVYTEYKTGIIKTIEKPLKVGAIYRENVLSSIQLINFCMPINECLDFANKALKVNEAELVQFQLVQAIYWKAWTSIANSEDENGRKGEVFVNFINNYLTLANIALKKDHPENSIVVTSSAYILESWLSILNDHQFDWDPTVITTSSNWSTFVKTSIKSGLSPKTSAGDTILRELSILFDIFYEDQTSTDALHDHFEQFTSHPAYFDIALGRNDSPLKESLFYLTFILIKKGPGLALEKHIPVYLGAYQASLSKTDQFILGLLKLYEQSKISLAKFRPFLWGEAAILRHSLRGNDEKGDLNKKSGNLETLNLIEEKFIRKSFTEFPVWRKLDAVSQVPVMTIISTKQKSELIEMEFIQNFIVNDKKLSLKTHFPTSIYHTDENLSEIYDPAFVIPLISTIFAPEQVDLTSIAVQKGLISFLFAALSSQDLHMRLAVGQALIRCRSHLDGGKRFLGKELWQRMYDSTQNGLHSLCKLNSSTKTLPRPISYATQFIGHSAAILPVALHDLYHALSNYYVVKSVFDFTSVPDFFNLFFNSEVKYVKHRLFILTILADGTKTMDDFMSLFKSPIIKILMCAYGSPLSDSETNISIMRVFKAITKLPLATDVLIVKCGFLTWFQAIIERTETWHFDTIVTIIETLANLFKCVDENKTSYKDAQQIEVQVLDVALTVLSKLTVKVPKSAVKTFYEVLYGISCENMNLVPSSSMTTLIEFSKMILRDEFQLELNRIIEQKGKGSENWMEYIQKIDKTCDDRTEDYQLFVYIREICINWYKMNEN